MLRRVLFWWWGFFGGCLIGVFCMCVFFFTSGYKGLKEEIPEYPLFVVLYSFLRVGYPMMNFKLPLAFIIHDIFI